MAGAINEAPPVTIASAATVNIGAAASNAVIVSGTVTVTAFGTIASGVHRTVRFSGALTLTHNSTSLILPTGASIVTAPGDVALVESLGSGNWRCLGYLRADGTSLVVTPFKFSAKRDQTAGPVQSCAGFAFTKLTFVTEEFDVGSAFDLPNSKFVAPVAGYYAFLCGATINLTTNGDSASVRIRVNGTEVRYLAFSPAPVATFVAASGGCTLQLAAGDVVELYVYIGASAARDVSGSYIGGFKI